MIRDRRDKGESTEKYYTQTVICVFLFEISLKIDLRTVIEVDKIIKIRYIQSVSRSLRRPARIALPSTNKRSEEDGLTVDTRGVCHCGRPLYLFDFYAFDIVRRF